jgi:putative ABC transport system permease protein
MKTPPLPRPPRLGYGLLSFILKRGEHWGLVGDFDELYAEKASEKGQAAARVWYWGQIAKFAPAYIFNAVLWSGDMFRNHMIVAWRNIKKRKAYSALNILGLAVGMAVFILIMLFVRTELSYDRFHAEAGNIFRVIKGDAGNTFIGSNVFARTPGPLAAALMRDFPEVRTAARISNSPNVLLSRGKESFREGNFFWADPQTFRIFSFPLSRGDRDAILQDPYSLVLSEKAARRFFGEADPIGQTLAFRAQDKTVDFRVEGVFRDIPSNSHFVMDVVAPFETMEKIYSWADLTQWGQNSFFTYLLLKEGTDPRAIDRKMPAFIDKYAAGQIGAKTRYFLQSLTRIHLQAGINWDFVKTGDARFVLLLSSIALLVLVIACVNYMNLATAQSLKRAKEVGLRKVVGATKSQLVRQFLGDSMSLTFIALILAMGLVLFALPAFKAFVERDLVFNPFRDPALTPGLLLLALAVGTAAGSYPAFFVSAFRPVSALRGTGVLKSKGRWLRNALIVFQFAASIALIICTLGIRSQLRYIRNRDMGYQREQIVVLTQQGGLRGNLEAFKTEIRRNPSIMKVAGSSCLPNDIDGKTFANWPGKSKTTEIPIYFMEADYDFAELYGLAIVRGRDFSRTVTSDSKGAFLINESAQKAIGWSEPIGRPFIRWGNGKPDGSIVGVVKDFHMHSLRLPIMPLWIFLNPNRADTLSIKIRGENIPQTLAFIRKAWERFSPEYPFEYSFFDEIFNRAYRTEQRLETLLGAFSGIAVFVACLGLFGLASFAAEQRTKEIGIRKVLGASAARIMAMFSRAFIKWVVLANLIAWPIGYFAMRTWLRNFAYRTSLTVPMFLGAALAAFAIAAAVISLQTYRAATANPADSIRCE